jgi:sugar O-acyltransferase (sialic acid O-acetyltransferase NeuD family)
MLKLIIVGAGGLGREIHDQARHDVDCGKIWNIAGFLDTRPHALDGYDVGIPLLGDPRTYRPSADEIYVVAIGDTKLKRELVEPLRAKGANLVSLRTRVHMGARTKWGASVFGIDAKIAVDVTIGDFVYLGADTIVGHDTTIGDYAHIGARVFIAGRVTIGPLVTIHPAATITMDAKIGEGAVIGAGSVVIGKVPAHVTMMGPVARRFEFKPG